jgi:hypothetical protein
MEGDFYDDLFGENPASESSSSSSSNTGQSACTDFESDGVKCDDHPDIGEECPPLIYENCEAMDTEPENVHVTRLSGVFHNSTNSDPVTCRVSGSDNHAQQTDTDGCYLTHGSKPAAVYNILKKLHECPFSVTVRIDGRYYTFSHEDMDPDSIAGSLRILVPTGFSNMSKPQRPRSITRLLHIISQCGKNTS